MNTPMTATRWTLVLLTTVAGVAGVAGVLHAMSGPMEGHAAAPARPPVAALPLNLAVTAAPARRATANTGAQPVMPPQAAALVAAAATIGSEGYGPHIERAQAGDDIAAAWQAVQWLQQCAANEQQRKTFEQLRNQGHVPQEAAAALLTQLDADARRCQTVTDQHRALLPELAARAMRAGVPLAAAAYADAVAPASLPPAQRQEVADALRRDARTNGVMSLLVAVQADDAWGLGDADRLGFHAALKQLADEPSEPGSINLARSLALHSAQRFKTPPTPDQQAAATLAGQQIVAHLHAAEQP